MSDFLLGVRRQWWKKPPKDVPQIPWAKHVVVTHLTDEYATLELPWARVELGDPFVSILIKSRETIRDHMQLDEELTEEFQKFYEESEENFFKAMDQWVRGPRVLSAKRGQKEWSPRTVLKEDIWKKNDYRSDNTYNWSGETWWLGDEFEFYHFETDEGEEGAIIFWHLSGDPRGNYSDPEVWMGSFSDFMSTQEEHDLETVETFNSWNSNFENGFLWAFNEFGMFSGSEHFPEYVIEAIEDDPSILTPEMMIQIYENPHGWPEKVVRHTAIWETKQRRKFEKGQKLFWRGFYPSQ